MRYLPKRVLHCPLCSLCSLPALLWVGGVVLVCRGEKPPLVSVSSSSAVIPSREGLGVVAVFPLCAFVAPAEVGLDDGIHGAGVWCGQRAGAHEYFC